MTDLISSDWKELDADNTQPSPNGVQGGYSPSQVAPIIRSIRGSLKRFYNQANPVYTSTGTATAYVLTFEAAPAGYSKGIIYRFWAHASNSGAATLNINSLGLKAIVSGFDGSPLIAGQIVSGRMAEVVFNGTAFELLNSGAIVDSRLPTTMTGKTFTGYSEFTGAEGGDLVRIRTNNFGEGVSAIHFKKDIGLNTWNINLWSPGGNNLPTFNINSTYFKHNGNIVWTSGNSGAGSGLDADMLDGYQATALPVSTPQQTALNLKANLASPAFTGTPTAPTQTQGNNSTRLATTAYVDTGLQTAAPTGSVTMWTTSSAPTGYLICNGEAVSRTTYAALFAVIGTTYGAGNGSTTFNLPDLRGLFVRGLDSGRGIDSGRTLGSYQDSDNKSHNHGVNDPGHVHGGVQNGQASTGRSTSVDQPPAVFSFGSTWGATTGIWLSASGGAESRPRNLALNYIIKI